MYLENLGRYDPAFGCWPYVVCLAESSAQSNRVDSRPVCRDMVGNLCEVSVYMPDIYKVNISNILAVTSHDPVFG